MRAKRLQEAVVIYLEDENHIGIWGAADDLSRTYATLSKKRPDESAQWLERASKISDNASAAGTEVWNTLREEGRLADLSEQMTNHTVTRCEIAGMNEDASGIMGTLALMKGRIRLVKSLLQSGFLARQSPEIQDGVGAGVPLALLELVGSALGELANGRTIALVDQFALRACL